MSEYNAQRKSIKYIALLISFTVICIILTVWQLEKNRNNSNQIKNPALQKVVLGTDWFAQAEHGGFYEAIAKGYYNKKGLDVEIRMGGPQVQNWQLLLAGGVDFFIAPSYTILNAAKENLPVIGVAAVFQKDVQVLIAHPNVGNDSLEQLKGKPIFISQPTAASIWPFLVGKYGYNDSDRKPYTNSLTPFLQDKQSVQEGILTSEPFTIEKVAGFKPVVLLLSDHGFNGYAEVIVTTKKFETEHPEYVKAFIDASLQGWKSYLEDPSLANSLIKKANPQMTDQLLSYAVEKLNSEKIITGNEGLPLGAMTDKRWEDFYNMLVAYKAISGNIDYKSVYTLKYVMPNYTHQK